MHPHKRRQNTQTKEREILFFYFLPVLHPQSYIRPLLAFRMLARRSGLAWHGVHNGQLYCKQQSCLLAQQLCFWEWTPLDGSLTVAGEATSRSMGSKMRLICGDIWIISPLIRHNFLLSSNTVFMFSIHTASTGPSKISHFLSGLWRQQIYTHNITCGFWYYILQNGIQH